MGISACGDNPQGTASTAAGGSSAGSSSGGAGSGAGGSAGTAGAAGSKTGGAGGTVIAGGSGGASGGSAGSAGSVTTGGSGGTTGSGGTMTGSGGSNVIIEVPCDQSHIYECGDTIDNDGDGLIDSQDPDCLGPCDNTEGGYYGGIPGQAGPACVVDCYFDSNSGSGNDDCFWSHQCDPHELMGHPEPNNKCPYDANANIPGTGKTCDQLAQMQSQTCATVCGPLTPNGCDCFGCCELPSGSGKYVWLGSEDANGNGSCSIAVINDPDKCQPCMPVPACLNSCDHCELCIGKDMLPPDCNPGSSSSSSSSVGSGGAGGSSTSVGSGGMGGTSSSSSSSGTGGSGMQCPGGIQACGLPGQAPCPADYYCITGCCQYVKPPG